MGKRAGRILVVDDNNGIRRALDFLLKGFFEEIKILSSPVDIISQINAFKPDVVLLDMNFKADINTGGEGLFWLKEIKRSAPGVEVVLFTAYADINLAVQGMKFGAADFVEKPWDNTKLISTLHDAVIKSRGQKDANADLIFYGSNPAMQDFWRMVSKIGKSEMPVIISGENGTGKKLAAKEIYKKSPRSDKGFEISGLDDVFSRIEETAGGTIAVVLNKEPDMRLLDSLKSKCCEADVRLILISDKIVPFPGWITLTPIPLRMRVEEIEQLSYHFIREYNRKHKREIEEIDNEALDLLKNYEWPGNISELRERLEKAVVMCDGKTLRVKDVFGDAVSDPAFLLEVTKKGTEEEINIIRDVLEQNGRNITLAAKLLNMSRPTLYSKIKKYGI